MKSNFSRTLALLRHEKGIKQRDASENLEISQALLSHYETGQREPGLAFVARAANYYNVSCDYLLGRSMSQNGSAITADQIIDISVAKSNVLKGSVSAMLHKKLVVNSASILMDIAASTGSKSLPQELSTYFSLVFYKAFRFIYDANSTNTKNAFSIPSDIFSPLCDSEIKMQEVKICSSASGGGNFGIKKEDLLEINISPESISTKFPGISQSLLSMLQTVSSNIEKKIQKK